MSLPPNLVMALVAPTEIGGDVGGWRLVAATSEGVAALYTLEHAFEQIVIAVEPRDTSRASLTRTRRWNVVLRGRDAGTVSDSQGRAIVGLVRLLKRNELGFPVPTASDLRKQVLVQPSGPSVPRASVLWLVPGHLGDPLDLSLRAVQVLAGASIWFVETGKAPSAVETLEALGVRDPRRRVVEIGDDDAAGLTAVLTELAARGEDACLFGDNEGIPAFLDPGSRLVEAAALCQPPLRVRSIGGASVLGTALMRIDRDVAFFTFLGHAGSSSTDARIRALLHEGAAFDCPAIIFAVDTWYRDHAAELGAFIARRHGRVVVLGDLTLAEESMVEWNPATDPIAPRIDARKLVMFLFPDRRRDYG